MRHGSYTSDELYDLAAEAPFDTSGRAYRQIFDHLEGPLRNLAGTFQSGQRTPGLFDVDVYVRAARLALVEWADQGPFFRASPFETAALAEAKRAMVRVARTRRALKRDHDSRVCKEVGVAHDRLAQRLGCSPTSDEPLVELNREEGDSDAGRMSAG